MKLQDADKFPRAPRFAVAVPERAQHDLVITMPLGTPLPNRPGAFERSGTLTNQIQVVQWVDLPLGVSEYSWMLSHFLLIDIEAHLFTTDVSPEPPAHISGGHRVAIPVHLSGLIAADAHSHRLCVFKRTIWNR